MCVCALSLLVCPSLTNSDKPLALLLLQNSAGCLEEHFVWESPIYKPQVEPRWSISCGKSLFTNSTCCLEERFHVEKFSIYKLNCSVFVWEIPIYKLNWSVSCGKFLFTNSTGSVSCGKFLFTNSTSVFSLFLQKLFYKTYFTNLFTNLILKGKSIFQANDPWSEILQSNSGFLYARA